jgi:hypothetical protein
LLNDCLDDVTLVASATAVASSDERNGKQWSVVIEWTRTAARSTRSSDELSDRGGVPLGRFARFAGVTDPDLRRDARSCGDLRNSRPASSELGDQSIPVDRKPEAIPRTNEVPPASQGIGAAGNEDRVTGEVAKIAKRDEQVTVQPTSTRPWRPDATFLARLGRHVVNASAVDRCWSAWFVRVAVRSTG